MKASFILLLSLFLISNVRAEEAQLTKRIEAKVTKAVDSYYKTHTVEGKTPPYGYIIVDVDITKTEPIDGWIGHFRTIGRATVSLVDGGANYALQFEATTENDEKDILRVTEVKTVKVE